LQARIQLSKLLCDPAVFVRTKLTGSGCRKSTTA
jgi:hypothetical protein